MTTVPLSSKWNRSTDGFGKQLHRWCRVCLAASQTAKNPQTQIAYNGPLNWGLTLESPFFGMSASQPSQLTVQTSRQVP